MAQFQDNQPTLSLYLASLLICNLHLVNSSSIKDSSRNSFRVNLNHQSPCRPRSNLDLVNLFLCRPSRVKLNLETYLEVNVMVIVYTTLLGLVAFKSQIQS